MRRSVLDLTQPGWAILIALGILVVVGVASVYVTDTHYVAGNDGPDNAAKQCLSAVIGLFAALFVLRIGYHRISKHAYLLFTIALLLLLPLLLARLLHTSFGGLIPERNGAHRWIRFPGFQLQPSEGMKVAYVLALAWYLRYRKNYRTLGGFLLPVLLSFVPLLLILLQPDLGMALLLVPVLFTMLFIAGAKLRHIMLTVLAGAALAPFTWEHLHSYQRLRVTAVLLQSETLRKAVIERPKDYEFLATRRQAQEWAAGSGYQLVHSKNAVGSGGWFGNGWGKGIYVDNNLLPDRHNDFVFAMVGHQWGLAGCVAVLTCYLVIVLSGVRIASATTEPFGRLLAVGIVTLIASQTVINVGMSVGLMPITGMTLPFVSYGGSSLLTNFMAIALLVSVSQYRPFLLAVKPFEYAPRRERAHPAEREAASPPSART